MASFVHVVDLGESVTRDPCIDLLLGPHDQGAYGAKGCIALRIQINLKRRLQSVLGLNAPISMIMGPHIVCILQTKSI